jgi:ElaB/YqjD/DUF883 family membrane-anchored ribosome-binding protein
MANELQQEINTTELLMQISKDVAVVKNEVSNMKSNMQEDMNTVNQRLSSLESKVAILERSEDAKYATRYKRVISHILVGVGGVFIAKLPDVIILIIKSIKG